MTKEERLAYLLSKYVDKDPVEAIGELPVTTADIADELTLSDGFQEHNKRNSKEHLTSDE